jgi:GMP synthase (glutamine-hydrolysing)
MSRSALVVRHVPCEGLAGFREPIEAAGYVLDRVDVADHNFAETDFVSPDLLILMGGPMGAYERYRYPWIDHEIERLQERLEHDRPTIGVCLGAQMIAAALGAEVYAGPQKEIGFFRLSLTVEGRDSPVAHIADIPILHWHGDTFDLPRQVELLASSDAYAHQAFRRGKTILGLQCHPEMGLDPRIEDWIEQSTDSLEGLGLCGGVLRSMYHALGRKAVQAGQAMISSWLSELEEERHIESSVVAHNAGYAIQA